MVQKNVCSSSTSRKHVAPKVWLSRLFEKLIFQYRPVNRTVSNICRRPEIEDYSSQSFQK